AIATSVADAERPGLALRRRSAYAAGRGCPCRALLRRAAYAAGTGSRSPSLLRRTGCALLLAVLLAGALPVSAQHPGSLTGRITDAATGAPLEGAQVRVVRAGLSATTDAAGRYRFRALEPGTHTLTVERLGYAGTHAGVRVDNGRESRLDLSLEPRAIELGHVTGAHTAGSGALHLERAAIAASGARSAGDALALLPGVVLRRSGPGGAQTVSLRGVGADAVLVLLDGLPLNDAVTGEADLSSLPAASLASITVLPGARSARYGPRAAGGVVLLETRAAGGERTLSAALGSLGEQSGALVWSGGGGPDALSWSAGASGRSVDGNFGYERPAGLGGGGAERTNADRAGGDAWLALGAEAAGAPLRLRARWEALERGLPGPSFAPSRHARQRTGRVQASAGWRRTGPASSLDLRLAAARQTVRFRDAAPPLGLPYDDSATVSQLDARFERAWRLPLAAGPREGEVGDGSRPAPANAAVLELSVGAEGRPQWFRASRLDAPGRRVDAGMFAHGATTLTAAGVPLHLSLAGRLDRDPVGGGAAATHALSVATGAGPLSLHAAHRSAYSPPSLADQFFRAGVGVEPNPALDAERVPGEVEVGASARGTIAGAAASIHGVVYRGDTRGMIVWRPDFRFVWSPANVDVRRRGGEVRGQASWATLRLAAWHAWSTVEHDRPDRAPVVYRPGRTGALEGRWHAGPWRVDATARYTGERFPFPTRVNRLAPFWTVDAGAARVMRVADWFLTATLRAERLLDQRETLIFGFPEPGRTLRLELHLSADTPTSPTRGSQP
ncbi:MAG: TonB-dependent receptor, partial [Gemmatimonadota bacterium]